MFWFSDSSAFIFEERSMCQKWITRGLWRNVRAPPIRSYFFQLWDNKINKITIFRVTFLERNGERNLISLLTRM